MGHRDKILAQLPERNRVLMSKRSQYLVLGGWLAALLFAEWQDSSAAHALLSIVSVVLGALVLASDPRNRESRRVGIRTIGIVLLIAGVLAGCLAIYEKVAFFR
jgi:hypothetical protein